MKFQKMIAGALMLSVLATGCQQAPEDAVVKEKNLDKMIAQAQETGTEEAAPEEMAEKYTTYKNQFANEKLGVKVKADARVEIPKTKQMSVVRVEQTKITQDLLNKVKGALHIDATLYDGSVGWVQTKSEIEKEIQVVKAEMASAKKDGDEEGMLEEYQWELEELQKKYVKAPKVVDWSKYPSNDKITSVKSLYEKNKNDDFYSWAYDLNKNGEIYYAITDEKADEDMGLYVQNNEERGNCLRFTRSVNQAGPVFHAAIESSESSTLDENEGMWPADRTPTEEDVIFDVDEDGLIAKGEEHKKFGRKLDEKRLYEYQNEPTTISEQEAKDVAENFLKEIGLTDYRYSDGGLYCETQGTDQNDKVPYRKVYFLRYLRDIDGVLVNNLSGEKYAEGYQGSEFVKNEWPGESIEFCINDSGIVTFNYNVPIQVTETVVEKAKLKNFDKIKKTFEKMIVTVNAQDPEEKEQVSIQVEDVVLRYMRISEKDSFDTGLLVPVWEFLGTKEYKLGGEKSDREESLLIINAIDGSVIDVVLGY